MSVPTSPTMQVINVAGAAGMIAFIALLVTSCFHETARWHANERAFCAEKGMAWHATPGNQLNVCKDRNGFAYPISPDISHKRAD